VAKKFILLFVVVALLAAGYFFFGRQTSHAQGFVSYQVDLQNQDLQLYWRNYQGSILVISAT
jgi:hypothetical protein